jgi:hypothetical protein
MFPPVFGQLARVGGARGLVISVIVVLLLANFVDLTAIASLGSAVALDLPDHQDRGLPPQSGNGVVELTAGGRHRADSRRLTRVRRADLRTEPATFVAIVGILALAIALDLIWSRIRARRSAAAD